MKTACCVVGVFILAGVCPELRGEWKPAKGPLMTRWSKDVRADNVHSEYPRPQMVRKDWLGLNGLWDYAIVPKDQGRCESFDGKILVPFAVESALSGVMKAVGEDKRLWYRRVFELPIEWRGKRILLNFGAVDWETTAWVNGKVVGTHRGGYDSFSFDITDALKAGGEQEIVLSVWDPTGSDFQPCGKQVEKPHKIWYTAVTGIWQSVWLEPVEPAHVRRLKILPDIDAETVTVTALCSAGATGLIAEAEVKDGWFTVSKGSGGVGEKIVLRISKPKLWSPERPFLYDLKVTLKDARDKVVDSVTSYFGMRKISLGKDEKGVTRIFFNNKILFQYGPLDQGWWPDGLYTAPSDEALRYDIEVTKELGCNMARKHVKIEPARWYYWCDKLGLLVWQDMPSGTVRHRGAPRKERSEESKQRFEHELKRMIDAFKNHPSIIMWVVFNEGWGQYDTQRLAKWVKDYDPSRLVNEASGYTNFNSGEVYDAHAYPGPEAPANEPNRAAVLGEFGGLGLPISGHTWQDKENWGYRSFKSREELTEAYVTLLGKVRPLIENGLCAAVYTQTTDVEIEVNGLLTYDRAMIKMDAEKVAVLNRALIEGLKPKQK